jgi:hypothetical protein
MTGPIIVRLVGLAVSLGLPADFAVFGELRAAEVLAIRMSQGCVSRGSLPRAARRERARSDGRGSACGGTNRSPAESRPVANSSAGGSPWPA